MQEKHCRMQSSDVLLVRAVSPQHAIRDPAVGLCSVITLENVENPLEVPAPCFLL